MKTNIKSDFNFNLNDNEKIIDAEFEIISNAKNSHNKTHFPIRIIKPKSENKIKHFFRQLFWNLIEALLNFKF